MLHAPGMVQARHMPRALPSHPALQRTLRVRVVVHGLLATLHMAPLERVQGPGVVELLLVRVSTPVLGGVEVVLALRSARMSVAWPL